jgi:hypothetical protein
MSYAASANERAFSPRMLDKLLYPVERDWSGRLDQSQVYLGGDNDVNASDTILVDRSLSLVKLEGGKP